MKSKDKPTQKGPFVIQCFMKDEAYYFIGGDDIWGTDYKRAVLFHENESALQVLFSPTCKRMGRSIPLSDAIPCAHCKKLGAPHVAHDDQHYCSDCLTSIV